MAAPALLSEEPLEVYHGDPLVIELTMPGDQTSHSFKSQIRVNSLDDAVLAEFVVGTSYNTQNDRTSVALVLDGDSAEGARDSKTRLVESTAVFDVQEYDEDGRPLRTVCRAKLRGERDITR